MNSSTSSSALPSPSPFSPAFSALSASNSTAPSSAPPRSPVPFPCAPAPTPAALERSEACPWEQQYGFQEAGRNVRGLSIEVERGGEMGGRVSRLRSLGRSTVSLRGRVGEGALGRSTSSLRAPQGRTSVGSVRDGSVLGLGEGVGVHGKAARVLGLPECPTPVPTRAASLVPAGSRARLARSHSSLAAVNGAGHNAVKCEVDESSRQLRWNRVSLSPAQYDWQHAFHLASDPSAATPTPTLSPDQHHVSPTSASFTPLFRGQNIFTPPPDFGADPDLALHLSLTPTVTTPVSELTLAEFMGFSSAIARGAYVFGHQAFDAALRAHAAEASLFHAVERLAWRGASKRRAPRLVPCFV